MLDKRVTVGVASTIMSSSMYVHPGMCHEVNQRAVAAPLISHLPFLARFKGQFLYCNFDSKVLFCHVTVTYLFSAKVTLYDENRGFSLFCRFVWRLFKISEQRLIQWTAILKIGIWARRRHQNRPLNLTPYASFGGRIKRICETLDFHFQMITLKSLKEHKCVSI